MAPLGRSIEMATLKLREDSVAHGSSYTMREPIYDDVPPDSVTTRFINSFRRDPSRRVTPLDPKIEAAARAEEANHLGIRYYDIRQATLQTAHSGLARKLKGRHLQMIAIGGSIGTGLFVASGQALNHGGPASLLIAFSLIGIMLYCTTQALAELAVAFPVAGSFSSYSTRFLDPSWGFAMGWNYALQWLVILPLEIVAATITITYWNKDIAKAGFVTLFLFVVMGSNLAGVRVYGEVEFTFAMVKVIAVIAFILLGIVINCGGYPGGGYIGGQYWQKPGAFNNGFKGLCSVFVTAAFSFAGTELVGLAAAETANPRKSLPTAVKQVFWRITLFYVVALTLVGLLVPYNEPRLLSENSDTSGVLTANASPFVIAIEKARIAVIPSVMNAVILVAVLSVGNSAVFGSSRTMAALADQNLAPPFLSYIDRKGRPLMAILIAGIIGLLSYIAEVENQEIVLDWLLASSGLSSIFTWGSICLCHIRFRKAWAHKGRKLEDLAYRSQIGIIGSYIGLSMNLLVLVAQFWVGAFPIGWRDMTSRQLAESFFLKYMAAPIVCSFYVCHKLYYRTRIVRIEDLDIDTGRREFALPILVAREAEEKRAWPRWKKVYKFLC
ncbi:General amino-acid permease GAP1 [Scedosporium apiospermum]|uniref:General amino-acid permease GAP1 n=1 Tax=Pseudallescheria apiosperma TaxID=563466 RepID=A0A084GAB2_PSEDA|nr:General amino-acid permease GAP1 [Scedosporium apiospermum]KEZ44274.1 General amino-acid permease GAP1 [Scedosporium apiospermum]